MADELDQSEVANVCVAVRCRPMSNKEQGEGQTPIAEFAPSGTQVVLNSKGEPHSYQFDHVFSPDTPQGQVFEKLGGPLLDKAFLGFNATIFAYGQTGSGKTHTMMNHNGGQAERGLIPRINEGLFERITKGTAQSETRRYLVCCSFLEIYNEIIYDLLVPKSAKGVKGGGLEIREQKGIGVYVKDLTEVVVETSDKLNLMIEKGFEHRSTAATKMNDTSSRSHCIFIIRLHQKDASDETKNTFSKINLVDLAGSERACRTGAEGDRLKEGANINKSLSALGNVINALSSASLNTKKVFVPYRDSKLTRVLQESLGGNSLCTMVAAMSPASANADETLSTLNYAKRAKTIKVTATKNEEASAVKKLEDEVAALKAKLEQQAMHATNTSMGSREKEEMESKFHTQIEELQSFMQQSWEDKQKLSVQYEEEQKKVREQAARAAEKMRNDCKRNLKLLKDKGDLELSLQALAGLESNLRFDWPDMISDAVRAGQHMRSQLHAVKLFRDSAGSDFSTWWSKKGGDDSVSLTLLSQAHTKLGAMRKELDALGRLEVQLEENMGHIGPKVDLSLREAQAKAGSADGNNTEELVDLLMVVQGQLAQHHAKALASMRDERQKLGFDTEMAWLTESLEEDPPSPSSSSRQTLRLALQAEVAAAKQGAGQPAAALPAASSGVPTTLGLSNLEWPDERITASSNTNAARCARLLQSVLFGGWCAATDSETEYLQVDLGEERLVTALSLQGRQPLNSDWSQTRDLLMLALGGDSVAPPTLPSGDKLPTAQKHFERPPVRLAHDIGMALVHKKACLGGWEVPAELHNVAELSREQKMSFFDELIERSSKACPAVSLNLSSKEIMTGKNCDETKRLLQLLCYLSFKGGGGLDDASPQWTTSIKLEVFTEDAGWSWCGAADAAPYAAGIEQASTFEANSDATSVKYLSLPSNLVASQIRVHPVSWQGHASLRCEVHVASKCTGDEGRCSLEGCVDLVSQGVLELQNSIQQRHSAKTAEEESKKAEVSALKDKAEQERDVLEMQLQDALAKLAEREADLAAATERSAAFETDLLKMTVEVDRLVSGKDEIEAELSACTQGKATAEETMSTLKEDNEELFNSKEELTCQLEVMTEECDLARAKEEELVEEKWRMEEEIMDTNNGYVWVTERLQEKEEEMEALEEQVRKGQSITTELNDRCSELQDELMQLRVDHQMLQGKYAEEVRMHKASQARYVSVLKERTTEAPAPAATIVTSSRPETPSTSPSTQAPGTTKTPEKAPAAPNPEDNAYEDDFDDEGED